MFLPVNLHPEVMVEARGALEAARPERLDSALERLDRQTPDHSQVLYLLESARLKELEGDLEASEALYAEAEGLLDDERLRATFTARGTMQTAVSLFTNDQALAYRGALFERILLHLFQSLNQLEQEDLAEARISLNKALRDLRWGTDNLPALRRAADRDLASAGFGSSMPTPDFSKSYAGLDLQSSADNALVYYLSGLLHQAMGDRDRAEIDYRNALAYAPRTEPIQHALETLGGTEPGAGRLVVLHESGWVSPKIPFRFPVIIKNRSYTLSFPYYPDEPVYNAYPESILRVGKSEPLLYPVLNVDAVARKALEEEFPVIFLRQVLRMVAKQELQAEANEADSLFGFAAAVFSILSDTPDLRSWLSLPGSIHLADLSLPAGTYELSSAFGEEAPETIELREGRITLVRLTTANGRVIRIDSRLIPAYSDPL